jgi:hypothetical protein
LPGAEHADAAARVKFSFAAGVSAADESYVREGIELGKDYIRAFLSGSIEDNLSVRVRATEHPDNALILAYASGNDLIIFTGSSYWDSLSPALRMQVVIHEYVHIYQRDTLGYGPDVSPMWLIEGMAEFVAYSALEDVGLLETDDVTDYQTWAIVHGGSAPDLNQLEEIEDFQESEGPVYPLGHMAVSLLLGADEPWDRLTEFLDEVDSGTEWRGAFEDAFGLELDEFYAEFDEWLANDIDSPYEIPTAFMEVVGRDRDAAVTILSGPDDELERGDQAIVIAETERSSKCRFDLRDEEGERVATLRTVADRTGLVFWVITIPDNAPLGGAEIVANCGGDRDRLRFTVLDE